MKAPSSISCCARLAKHERQPHPAAASKGRADDQRYGGKHGLRQLPEKTISHEDSPSRKGFERCLMSTLS